jgi:hypothetical protein
MKGKAGSGRLTKPTQPKAPEDNYQKGSRQKGKSVAIEEDDVKNEDEPVPVCIGPPSTRRIRELPYVDVPPLSRVERADRPKPTMVEGPSYTMRAPIEKEGLGNELLEEILNASLDVTVGQLLGSAPGIRKEMLKQLAKTRRAPGEEPKCLQFKATIEDEPESDESKTYSEEEYNAMAEIIKEKINGYKYEPSSSSYVSRHRWFAVKGRTGSSDTSQGDEFPRLTDHDKTPKLVSEPKELDVATLLLPECKMLYSSNGKKSMIVMGDPVVQYLNSLPKGETPRMLYVRESALALRSIYPVVNNMRQEEALLDSGSQIVSISKDAAITLKMSWNPDICINMQSAQEHVEKMLGLATDVPFAFGDLTILLQVHVINKPSYKILLGRPFDALTRSNVQNERDGLQIITIMDPGSDTRVVLPTYPRGQKPSASTEGAESFHSSLI